MSATLRLVPTVGIEADPEMAARLKHVIDTVVPVLGTSERFLVVGADLYDWLVILPADDRAQIRRYIGAKAADYGFWFGLGFRRGANGATTDLKGA